MAFSMYTASAPVFGRLLGNMDGWFDKAEQHAAARRFDTVNYLGLRLAPDMLAFNRQIHICSDGAKGCMARLAGMEVPKWADDETTLEALRERVRRTVAYVASFAPGQLDGSEEREIVLPMRSGELRFSGADYLQTFALPNVYFHATTAYALLRQAGVELGKRDFLGG